MEAVTHPRACEIGVLPPLQRGHLGLRTDGGQVKHRVGVVKTAQHLVVGNRLHRVQRHHHGLLERHGLQPVEEVVQADPGIGLAAVGGFVVPRGPGRRVAGQHTGVGVQHGAVGLVVDGPEHLPLLRGGVAAQQGQRLVGMGGQHESVETLGARVGGDGHTACVACDLAHGGVQAFVGDARGDLVDIVARTASHRPPLRALADLRQAVVVAKAHHRGHGELQHLVGRAAPDTAEHGQQVPVAEFGRKLLRLQKLGQRLGERRFCTTRGQVSHQFVETQQVAQHAPESGAQQVGTLGKHGVEAGAAPLERAALRTRHLHGKRHVGRHGADVQLFQERDEFGVGAFVEHQETGVNAVADGVAMCVGQRDVNGVGVAAEIGTRLEQGDVCFTAQRVGSTESCNAGADNCDSHMATAA